MPILRFANVRVGRKNDTTLVLDDALAASSPLSRLSLDALNDAFPLEVATYPAPALADLDGDLRDDLILGGLYGTLLYFPAAEAIDARYTEDAPQD